jgi:hypothetical protein
MTMIAKNRRDVVYASGITQGDQGFLDTHSKEYFEGHKRG